MCVKDDSVSGDFHDSLSADAFPQSLARVSCLFFFIRFVSDLSTSHSPPPPPPPATILALLAEVAMALVMINILIGAAASVYSHPLR